MRNDLYKKFEYLDDHHWWFIARKKILRNLLKSSIKKEISDSLDIGSGPGINVSILQEVSKKITCLEASDEAIKFGNKKYPELEMIKGYFPATIPNRKFDMITMFDVLEHIDNDSEALRTAYSLLKTGGYFIMTVPSYMFLWSEHDEHVHHKRRYTKKQIIDLLKKAGFEIDRITYFNTILFPAIAFIRIFKRIFNIKTGDTDFDIGSPFLNSILTALFKSEVFFLNKINFPFGVSLFCVAQKKEKE